MTLTYAAFVGDGSECNKTETRRLLQDQPEFARAVAQAQLRLGMIKEHTASAPGPANGIGVSNDLMEKLDPEQQELLEQVQNLAPEIIQSLPPAERRQIMELREAMGLPPL
ncbi:Transcription termination and cleavage factor C-terminal domain [Plasmopara halstedii]|uniref:Transcription termination and cleavage factor C-terminal domain n=1 Tax=Plasmopara halstedii TaxID=4781 RepID=A0A0N7L5G8_PLAHL|nr:Transcription termination and cleavage factor C-terminal domain [Plasmopara halstedii]CEG41435.1 Transcription termination and cleavage factor C-terminal domain [Plasmopara halstedii]|eukprot:XP_024577804.1 Transcription termination and cleavage factor C-terminal domain [Plasmopara halstedii]